MTAEAEGDVTMATVASVEDMATKPQTAMSARASAFTIASLMADRDGTRCRSVSTSSTTTDSNCVSTSGTCCGRCQHQDMESPSASPQNCNSSTSVGLYTLHTA